MKFGRGGAAVALAWMVAMGCGTSSNDVPPPAGNTPNDTTTPATTDDDAGDGDAAVPPGTPAPPPPVTGIPVDGIFVSSESGNDAADATKARPVKTLARAIQIAQEKKGLAIIACANQTYAESVTLTDGLSIYGYYDCASPDWKQGDKFAVIQSPTSPAVLADSLLSETRMEGFAVSPVVGSGPPGASSYGMVVRNAFKVTLADMAISAANAQGGVDGVESTAKNDFVTPKSAIGSAADGTAKRTCSVVCNFEVKGPLLQTYLTAPGSRGGYGTCTGGGTTNDGGRGGPGRIGRNGAVVIDDLKVPSCAAPDLPGAGTAGARGAFGTNGAWSFNDSGFIPGDGVAGQTGLPGMGGLGGAGLCAFEVWPPSDNEYYRAGVGGGGGAGGCGGFAGTPGSGGGASVGLFVVNSGVTMTRVNIHAAKGGRGGAGAGGADGAPGASGGGWQINKTYQGAAGNPGGPGGKGGQSGHGAPGPSIALVYRGARPTTIGGGQLTYEAAGDAPIAVTDGAQSLPSPDRIAKAEHSF